MMNVTFFYWFLNVVTRNFRMSWGGRLILDGNPKGCEVSEHIATKFKVNPRILSTLKNAKSIWSMNPGANFETSVVGTLVFLVDLVRRKIGQVSYKSGRFVGEPYTSPFLAIIFSLAIETWPKFWRISWERSFEISQKVGKHIFLFIWKLNLTDLDLNIVQIVLSLVGWYPRTTLRFNKVTMFKRFFIRNLFKSRNLF